MYNIDTIGLVGGGQMGEALHSRHVNAGLLVPDRIMVAEPDSKRAVYLEQEYGVRSATEAAVLASASRIIILAVKPQIMTKVLAQYKDHITEHHLVISIAAGVTIRSLEDGLGLIQDGLSGSCPIPRPWFWPVLRRLSANSRVMPRMIAIWPGRFLRR